MPITPPERTLDMDDHLPSARLAGRLAGLLFVCSGAFSAATLLLPQVAGNHRLILLTISGLAVAVGGAAYALPWHRWNPRASLVLPPVALGLISAGNYYANAQPYTYSVFFIVA